MTITPQRIAGRCLRLLLLVAMLCRLAGAPPARAEIVDRIVAIVNDEVITLSEVNEAGKALFRRLAEEVDPKELPQALHQARQNVLEQLIEKTLLLQEAAKYGLTVSKDEVDAALERILRQNKATPEQFRAELARMGLTEAQYRETLRDRILSYKVINREVRSKIVIPESRIIDYYDTHYTKQVGEGGYYLLQIGVQWGDAVGRTKEEARALIEELRRRAVSGEDFKELARNHSDLPSAEDGGDIGVFTKEEMAGPMRQAVVGLEPGGITPVLETPVGFQILKLLSSQEGQIITKVPYESVKEEIRQTLYQEEMEKRLQSWLDEMRQKSYIKIL